MSSPHKEELVRNAIINKSQTYMAQWKEITLISVPPPPPSLDGWMEVQHMQAPYMIPSFLLILMTPFHSKSSTHTKSKVI
jgi:hypothetical protein